MDCLQYLLALFVQKQAIQWVFSQARLTAAPVVPGARAIGRDYTDHTVWRDFNAGDNQAGLLRASNGSRDIGLGEAGSGHRLSPWVIHEAIMVKIDPPTAERAP